MAEMQGVGAAAQGVGAAAQGVGAAAQGVGAAAQGVGAAAQVVGAAEAQQAMGVVRPVLTNEERLTQLRAVHSWSGKKQQKLLTYVLGIQDKQVNDRMVRKVRKLLMRLGATANTYGLNVNGDDGLVYLRNLEKVAGCGGNRKSPLKMYNLLPKILNVYYKSLSDEEHRLSLLISAAAPRR